MDQFYCGVLYRSVRSQGRISTLKMLPSAEDSAGSVFKAEIPGRIDGLGGNEILPCSFSNRPSTT